MKKIIVITVFLFAIAVTGTFGQNGESTVQIPSGGTLIKSINIDNNVWVRAVKFSNDGSYLAVGTEKGEIIIFDTKNYQEVKRFVRHNAHILSLDISPDNTKIASCSYDNIIKIWDVPSGKELHMINTKEISVNATSVSFSPDGKFITGGERNVNVWNVTTGELVYKARSGGSPVLYSPDGKLIIIADFKTIQIINAQNGNLIKSLNGHENIINSIAVTSNNDFILSVSQDNTIRIWDIENGIEIQKANAPFPTRIAVSPSDIQFAVGFFNGVVNIINVMNGAFNAINNGGYIFSISYSPDGNYIAVGSNASTLKIWSVKY